MSDERAEARVEARLRAYLDATTAGDAPESLRAFLAGMASDGVTTGGSAPLRLVAVKSRQAGAGGGGRRLVFGGIAAGLAAAVVIVALVGRSVQPGPAASPTAPAVAPASPSASASPAVPVTPAPTPTIVGVGDIVDAAPVTSMRGWVLTSTDLLWTTDFGSTWQSILPTGVAVADIRAVHFSPDADAMGWIATWSADSDRRVTIWRTTDSGASWRASHLSASYADGVGRLSLDGGLNTDIWLVVQTPSSSNVSRGDLWHSADGGISWDERTAAGGGPVRFGSAGDGWAVVGAQSDVLEHTTDGGSTWPPVAIAPPAGFEKDAVTFGLPTIMSDLATGERVIVPMTLVDPATGTAMLAFAQTDADGAFGPASFASVHAGPAEPGDAFPASIVSDRAWFASIGGKLAAHVGDTTRVSPLPPLLTDLATLQFVDPANGWAISGATGTQTLAATEDGGASWHALHPRAAATPAVTATPAATTGASASPDASASWTWRPGDTEGALATYDIGPTVEAGDGSYLAFARRHGASVVTVLTSRDGATWTVATGVTGLDPSDGTRMTLVSGVAWTTTGYVAVGADALGDGSPTGDARSWTSADGIHWTASPAQADLKDAAMLAVAAAQDGFVAVGADGYPGGNVQLPGLQGAMSWRSTDGLHWTRAPKQASLRASLMLAVSAFPVGGGGAEYLATGMPGPVLSGGALAWTSADGLSWTRATVPGFAASGFDGLPAFTRTPEGTLVAVGRGVDGAWASRDRGHTWSRAGRFPTPTGMTPEVNDVRLVGGMLMAVGDVTDSNAGGSSTTAAAWTSIDEGATWTRLVGQDSFRAATLRTILPTATGATVFGVTTDPNALVEATLLWTVTPGP